MRPQLTLPRDDTDGVTEPRRPEPRAGAPIPIHLATTGRPPYHPPSPRSPARTGPDRSDPGSAGIIERKMRTEQRDDPTVETVRRVPSPEPTPLTITTPPHRETRPRGHLPTGPPARRGTLSCSTGDPSEPARLHRVANRVRDRAHRPTQRASTSTEVGGPVPGSGRITKTLAPRRDRVPPRGQPAGRWRTPGAGRTGLQPSAGSAG